MTTRGQALFFELFSNRPAGFQKRESADSRLPGNGKTAFGTKIRNVSTTGSQSSIHLILLTATVAFVKVPFWLAVSGIAAFGQTSGLKRHGLLCPFGPCVSANDHCHSPYATALLRSPD